MKVHNIVISGLMQTAKSVARVLDVPKATALKLLRSGIRMLPYRYQHAQILNARDHQQCIDFANIHYLSVLPLQNYHIRYDGNNDLIWTEGAYYILRGNANIKIVCSG